VMSYLTGPLTRGQIKTLMDPKRGAFEATTASKPAAEVNPMGMPGMKASPSAPSSRPIVGAGVEEIFVRPAGSGVDIIYQPHLLRCGVVHFSSSKMGVDGSRTVSMVNPVTDKGIDWETSVPVPSKIDESGTEPAKGAGFAELPGFAMNAANYKQVEKDFSEWLYRNERADVISCPTLKAWSKLGESEADFRARLSHEAREARDAAIDKLREAVTKKVSSIESRLQTAEGQLAKQKAESNSAMMNAGVSVLGGVLGAIFGRKSGRGSLGGRSSSSIGKATSAYKQREDVTQATAKIEGITAEIAAAKSDLEDQIAKLTESYDSEALTLETESIKPTKTDVKVQTVALLWLPFDERGEKAW